RRGPLLPRPEPDGDGRGAEVTRLLQAPHREVPQVEVPARLAPGLRRVLLQRIEGEARRPGEGAGLLQGSLQVPRERRLRLRALQAGLVLLQPGRLREG